MDEFRIFDFYEFSTREVLFFLLDVLICILLTAAISQAYIRFGIGSGNKRRFAHNFIPLALATMLIIGIVKTSLALSLGLVGALSIVRFRAAIKEPEELVFLFIVIALGIGIGANQVVYTSVLTVLLLIFFYVRNRFRNKSIPELQAERQLVVSGSNLKPSVILNKLQTLNANASLSRMDKENERTDLVFSTQELSTHELELLLDELRTLYPDMNYSYQVKPILF